MSESSVMVGIDAASLHVDVAAIGAELPASLARMSKTDRIEAATLAEVAGRLARKPDAERFIRPVSEREQQDLVAVVRRWRQLVAMQRSERQRLRLARPVARPSIGAMTEAIKRQLDDVEAERARHVEQRYVAMAKVLQVLQHRLEPRPPLSPRACDEGRAGREPPVVSGRRRSLLASAAAIATAPLAGRSWGGALAAAGPVDTRELAELAFGEDPRHRLDAYLPAGTPPAAGWPVVVFFYGGSWNGGSRATYRFVGRALASRGMLAVIPDYRVYPQVRYPAFLEDGARALAWTRRQLGGWGGDPARLFVAGHSAGAYNAAMLALDPRWLAEAGVPPGALAGFWGLAGPYDFLPIENPAVKPVFFHPDYPAGSQPIEHARGFDRPVFLGTAASDSLVDPKRNTSQLAGRLREAGTPVVERLYGRANHFTLVGAFAWPLRWIAPVLDDVTAFVAGG
jgi:acetyl esterase/lipase